MTDPVSPAEALAVADRALDLVLKTTEGLGLMNPISRIAMLNGRAQRLRSRADNALRKGWTHEADRLLRRAATVQARADKLEALL